MKSLSAVRTGDMNDKNVVTLENERKQLREETLKWISVSALSRLRLVWGS
jgi:hypothetical protein